MDLKSLIFVISTIVLALGALDYFGYTATVEKLVDKTREELGEMVKRAGIFRPVIALADALLPENTKSPAAKVTKLAMMGISAPIFAIMLLFLLALLQIGEFIGLVNDSEQVLASMVIAIIDLTQAILDPLKNHISNSVFVALGTALTMMIFSVLGYLLASIWHQFVVSIFNDM